MDRSIRAGAVLCALIIIAACFAGCSDSSSQETTTATPAPTSSGAMYGAGDIVKNPKSTGAALLIIAFNEGTNQYERAYIYPNTDGSWGYRMDSKTDSIDRQVIEKVYTDKVATVEVSSVKIQSAASTTTAVTAVTTTAKTTTTATVTTTTTSTRAPIIRNVEPDKGKTGTTLSITNIVGDNFVSGATVFLKKTGETSLNTSSVSISDTSISCKVAIPSDADVGFWDVVVTNPDGQSAQYQNAILVVDSDTTTKTVTATPTPYIGTVKITSITPTTFITGGGEAYMSPPMEIFGNNLGNVSSVKLTKSGTTINAESYYATSATAAKATFRFPTGSTGLYTLSALDSKGNTLASLSNAITIQ